MNFLGIDVSKAQLDGCLLREDHFRKTKVVAHSAPWSRARAVIISPGAGAP